ncbi:hypothetical protein ACFLQ4_01980 [Bacteroidota bacterium]
MNSKKAKELANNWLSQNPRPKSLEPKDVFNVLEALGFIQKKKVKKDTTYIYEHPCLINDPDFKFGVLYFSINHGKGKKSSILVGGVKVILKALSLHPELQND